MLSTKEFTQAIAVGVGATVLMDLTGLAIEKLRGVKPLDYRLLGRWLGHLPEGTLAHESIIKAEPVAGERELGWAAHYVIGTGFVVGLALVNPGWIRKPTLLPALAMGVGTLAAPWFVMQPAFGFGMAASKAPDPTVARLRSLRTHVLYGVGAWVAARAVRFGH